MFGVDKYWKCLFKLGNKKRLVNGPLNNMELPSLPLQFPQIPHPIVTLPTARKHPILLPHPRAYKFWGLTNSNIFTLYFSLVLESRFIITIYTWIFSIWSNNQCIVKSYIFYSYKNLHNQIHLHEFRLKAVVADCGGWINV